MFVNEQDPLCNANYIFSPTERIIIPTVKITNTIIDGFLIEGDVTAVLVM